MKADLSRDTFDRTKRYAGVFLQQGRVLLQADLNEESSIRRHRVETEAGDVIGACGAPDGPPNQNFEVIPTPDLLDVQITPGRIYVDGLLCESAPTELSVVAVGQNATQVQVPIWRVDGHDFAVGQSVELRPGGFTHVAAVDPQQRILTFADPAVTEQHMTLIRLVTYSSQPDQFSRLPENLASGRYLFYLDVWERHITALEDEHLREVALGGPDTATRSKVVWQVKHMQTDPGISDCVQLGTGWPSPTSNGRLRARVKALEDPATPCLLPPARGFQGLENQLYRVEIHQGGVLGSDPVTFKWQRDNATVVAAIDPQSVGGKTVTLRDLGPDPSRGFADLQLVEATDELIELDGPPPLLLTIEKLDPTTREVTLSSAPNLDFSRRPKLRRWDGQGTVRAPGPDDPAWFTLDPGLEVQFSVGTYQAGDFWLVPARTATTTDMGTIEWLRDDEDRPLARAPLGIKHHYCALALVDYDATTKMFGSTAGTDLFDCRPIFPALTEVAARHVSFQDDTCGLGATTVQEALDVLCRRQPGICTIVVGPADGWEQALAQIPEGQDAQICFQAGDFIAPNTVDLIGKGHITVSGCGRSTRIRVPTKESAFNFDGCQSVTVRDLDIESGVAAGEEDSKHLRGTLNFRNCPEVQVECVRLACAGGPGPNATCITVNGAEPSETRGTVSVRIRSCTLDIGFLQIGILLTDVMRAQIEDNDLRVRPWPVEIFRPPIWTHVMLRLALRRWLLPSTEGGRGRDRLAEISVPRGDGTLPMRTPRAVAGVWAPLLAMNPAPEGIAEEGLRNHLGLLVNRVFADEPVEGAEALRRVLRRLDLSAEATVYQGIVVGGRVATEVRIVDNTIRGVVQGIHIGVSHRDASAGLPDLAGRVTVAGNSIDVVPVPAPLQHHAVFVGNCDSLFVENNFAVASGIRPEGLQIDSIRVFGHLGRRLIITHNHMEGFTTGIAVRPILTGEIPSVLWLVTQNVTPGANSQLSSLIHQLPHPGGNVS